MCKRFCGKSMLEQQVYALSDLAEIRSLIDQTGWATLVTATSGNQLIVSHLPLILDPGTPELTVLGHLPRSEVEAHEFGKRDVVIIVQGPNGYISPTMYGAGPYVPTWNFMVVHLHGRPETVDDTSTYAILAATVDHFESTRTCPWQLESVKDYAHRIARETVGFRLRPQRVAAKAKLSQDKPLTVVQHVIAALENDQHHRNTALADAMRRHLPGYRPRVER
jgi:transcriptional regulator